MLGLIERWFGADNYEVDPRTGRPKAPQSWLNETIGIWGTWFLGLSNILLVYLSYRRPAFDHQFALLGALAPIFLTLAILRTRSLKRKKAELRRAIAVYENGLVKAFTELEEDLHQAEPHSVLPD